RHRALNSNEALEPQKSSVAERVSVSHLSRFRVFRGPSGLDRRLAQISVPFPVTSATAPTPHPPRPSLDRGAPPPRNAAPPPRGPPGSPPSARAQNAAPPRARPPV